MGTWALGRFVGGVSIDSTTGKITLTKNDTTNNRSIVVKYTENGVTTSSCNIMQYHA